ncbi:ornithine cyclodeaminase family protein [Agromyces salentinus]|uniref:Ornithine cyclodeaminase family protein n=1 Tax=Agromyces salentinus TaxID=269421 RepID=A0ABP4YQD2_9MICO|nr:ornithine cyclodeaminase family protein [Agromyces salentinus]
MSGSIEVLDAAATRARLGYRGAVAALEAALLSGFDPATDVPRTAAPLGGAEALLMPSAVGDAVGVKVLTVAPGNPALGLPRIQGVHLVLDPATFAPALILDGAVLTGVRTPAVSMVGIRRALDARVAAAGTPLSVVVFGTGPQAVAHVEALREVCPDLAIGAVTHVARRPPAEPASLNGSAFVEASDAASVADLLGRAGFVVCATTAREPLFDSAVLRDDVVVVAVGSHEADARELDSALLARAVVVVEDVATALREAGDVVLAVRDGSLDPESLVPLAEVVSGRWAAEATTRSQPFVVKTTGMSWEDAVVGATALDR